MDFPFYRRNRGPRKNVSEPTDITVSRAIRPRRATTNSKMFQAQQHSYAAKPYQDQRHEIDDGGRRRYTYEIGKSRVPAQKPPNNNLVVLHDHTKQHRQYGKQQVNSRQTIPLPNKYPLKSIDPEIFRQNKAGSIISSTGSSKSDTAMVGKNPPQLLLPQPSAAAIVPPTGLRNFKHKLFAQFRTDSNSQEDRKELPRAPTTQMIEIQLSYVMARQHESSVLLTLQMDEIRVKIELEMKTLSQFHGKALCQNAIRHLFAMCEYLKLSDHVKYLAVEIYDRFMLAHSAFMAEEILRLDEETILGAHQRIQAQSRLRLATCIQLASKVAADASCDVLSSSAVQAELIQNFSVKAVSSSELRVLSLIKYKLNYITTLDIIEIILVQLELDTEVYRRIYEFCIYLLDHIMDDHEEVYNSLFKLSQEKNPTLNRFEFRKVEYNKLVEASGIVACCVYAFKENEYKIYLHAISSITKIDESTFIDLAAILVKNSSDQLWSRATGTRTP